MNSYINFRVVFLIILLEVTILLCKCSYTDRFDEKLLIRPLSTGHVYTHFRFVVEKDLNEDFENSFNHFRLFPRSLGETILQNDVQELHFSLTQGLWRYEKWGYPVRSSPPGAELWALFKGNESEVTSNWKKLTHILSGQFCASLNFIEDSNTAIPKLSFTPEGAVPLKNGNYSAFPRYASLPSENICTENLTPFRKLLPCGAQAGLSTLLNALEIFKSHFVSIAVDVQTVCKENCQKTAIQLVQSVSIVFDNLIQQDMVQDWSFVKLFGVSLRSTCPVATESKVFVDLTTNETGVPFTLNHPFNTVVEDKKIEGGVAKRKTAVFDLKEMFKSSGIVNIAATYNGTHIYGLVPPLLFYADRKVTGYGQEQGGIHCTLYNNHPKLPIKILYFDVVPWYLRLYSHTLSIKNGGTTITPDYLHYQPAKDRSRPHHLEMVLTLPPKSKTEVDLDFDLAFLKWTEYPPDANHGFYAGSAVVTLLLKDTPRNGSGFPGERQSRLDSGKHENFPFRIYTQILLVSLPTPDFSMPYNVICLTCTVVALAFGPIHNITTKSLYPIDENEEKGFISKLKKKIKNWWKPEVKDDQRDVSEESKKTQ